MFAGISLSCAGAAGLSAGRRLDLRTVGGEGKWQQPRAKDQLEVAQAAFDKKAYGLALKAARRVVQVWPLSDYAPRAQYLVARCYEATGKEEKAFKAYQTLLEKQPKIANFDEILQRQFEIANQFLRRQVVQAVGLHPALLVHGAHGQDVW